MRILRNAVAVLSLLAVFTIPARSVADDAKGLYVFVTSADVQTQMMAMVLSTKTVEQGKSVRMLLCGPGGELALKGSAQTMVKPLDKSPQMMLKNLIKKGVVVEVCAVFLPNRGGSPDDLIEGVAVAKPPVVAEKLREEGIKLFSF